MPHFLNWVQFWANPAKPSPCARSKLLYRQFKPSPCDLKVLLDFSFNTCLHNCTIQYLSILMIITMVKQAMLIFPDGSHLRVNNVEQILCLAIIPLHCIESPKIATNCITRWLFFTNIHFASQTLLFTFQFKHFAKSPPASLLWMTYAGKPLIERQLYTAVQLHSCVIMLQQL